MPDADPLSIRTFSAVGATEDRHPLDYRVDYFLVADENITAASSNPGAQLRISIWEADFDPVLTNDAGYNRAIKCSSTAARFGIVLENCSSRTRH